MLLGRISRPNKMKFFFKQSGNAYRICLDAGLKLYFSRIPLDDLPQSSDCQYTDHSSESADFSKIPNASSALFRFTHKNRPSLICVLSIFSFFSRKTIGPHFSRMYPADAFSKYRLRSSHAAGSGKS